MGSHLRWGALAALALFGLAAPAQAQDCPKPWFYPSKGACLNKNKKCAPSINRKACWVPLWGITVSGTNDQGHPVIFKTPPHVKVRFSGQRGTVYLSPSRVVRAGPSGVASASCNRPTNECICPDQCKLGRYGALMRNRCEPNWKATTVNSGNGRFTFFVNGDCKPKNNSGKFIFKAQY